MVGKEDPAFQAALQIKLQEEEKKTQERIGKEQDTAAKRRQTELDKAAEESRKAKEAEDASQAARNRADQDEAVRLAKEASEARQREDAARQAAAALPKTKEGDLVDVSQVDAPPVAKKVVKPEPTSLSLQRHVSGTVMMRVLVDENGHAEKIEVLRDTSPRVGLADACKSALGRWEWSPAMKDGKRVKTWIAVPIPFKNL